MMPFNNIVFSPEEYQIHIKFLNICDILSEFSHCASMKVGCILVRDRRIISTGYNGTPAGTANCDQIFNKDFLNRDEHHYFSEQIEIHAEINTILTAARYGISIKNTSLYTNLQPCANCMKMICNSGIKNVYYRVAYDKLDYSDYLKKAIADLNINIIQIKDCN